jgi:hypothetical protein
MTWFEDLAPCEYFGNDKAGVLRAVGWLERGRPFAMGSVPRVVYEKLLELNADPWQPVTAAGPHACDLCVFAAEAHGAANLFIPSDGFIFVAPGLVVHYMNAHGYAPPGAFCSAVLACPPMRSSDYRRAILRSGGSVFTRSA